ncbi:MAG: lipid A export permease/ATP-binding protein MsbA [Proteobacteria bacterium]|nr:lipid A export permease/ATP-binding protein MsbA [Pseudomonadota bacterium]
MSTGASSTTGWQTYSRLLGYTFSKWPYLLLGSVSLLVFSGLDALTVYLLGPFIDGAFVDKNYDEIKWIPAVLLLVIVLRGIANFTGTYYIGYVGAYVIKALRQQMFDRLQYLPAQYFDFQATGSLLSKFSYDVEHVIGAASKSLRSLVEDTSKIVFLLGVMAYNNWKLTLIFLVVAPLIAAVVGYTSRLFRRYSTRIQQSVGKITHIVEESITGHRIVKLFGGQDYEIRKFGQANEGYRRSYLRKVMTKAASTPVIQMLVGFVLVVVLAVAARPVMASGESAGEFVAFIVAMVWILTPARKLTLVNEILQTGIAAGESVFELIDTEKEQESTGRTLKTCQGRIEYRGVGFKYTSREEQALSDINLSIEPGETVAFVGRSGSGKSTIVNLLPRFYDADHGSILVDGTDIREFSLTSLRAQIAFVSQEVVLFNDTIANNITYAKNAKSGDQQVLQAARAACVLEFTDKLADGLDTEVGENGVLLSGGQRQRIAIARALLKDAPVLILDEATSSLDSESEKYIQSALEAVQKDRTTLIIAHRLSTTEKADRVVVMDKGRVAEIGTPQELLERDGVYAGLYRLQARHVAVDL